MSFRLVTNSITLNDRAPTQRVFFAIYRDLVSTFAAHQAEHNVLEIDIYMFSLVR